MRYMLMFKPLAELPPGEVPCKQNLPEMAKLIGELKEKGIVQSTEGLLPSDSGARLRFQRGSFSLKDGPFAEAKELVAGVAIVNVNSKSEAVAIARQFLEIAGDSEADILEIYEPSLKG